MVMHPILGGEDIRGCIAHGRWKSNRIRFMASMITSIAKYNVNISYQQGWRRVLSTLMGREYNVSGVAGGRGV